MICPSCSEEIDPVGTDIAPPLAVCPSCERSLVLDAGALRIAASADTQYLTLTQKTAIVALRTVTRAARLANAQKHSIARGDRNKPPTPPPAEPRDAA